MSLNLVQGLPAAFYSFEKLRMFAYFHLSIDSIESSTQVILPKIGGYCHCIDADEFIKYCKLSFLRLRK